MRKKVFICSPFRGDMEGNARKAAAYCRMACEQGFLPVAPHLLFPQFLNEGIEEERRLGISMGMELLALCDEVWVFGEATEGMAAEIAYATEQGKEIIFKEFERVQKMMAEKDAQMGQRRKNKGVHSDDLWRRKMRCQCGHAFAKTKWHTKTDFITYTYKCYDQTRTGTIAARLKNGLSIEGVCRSPLVQDWKMYTMAQKVLHAVFDDPEGTLLDAAAVLGCGIAGVEQSEVLRDKEIIEEQLKKERGRYETLLDMRMNNEIPKEVFSRKQQEVGEKIAELEQRMAQYGDVEPATEADVSGKLENLQRLMGQFSMPEDGEFSEEEMDRYVSGVRVYEDRFEWLLNLSPDAGGGLDDAGSPVYFKKITVTPDDERAWFRKHPQWSKSNRYAELEAWIFI